MKRRITRVEPFLFNVVEIAFGIAYSRSASGWSARPS